MHEHLCTTCERDTCTVREQGDRVTQCGDYEAADAPAPVPTDAAAEVERLQQHLAGARAACDDLRRQLRAETDTVTHWRKLTESYKRKMDEHEGEIASLWDTIAERNDEITGLRRALEAARKP